MYVSQTLVSKLVNRGACRGMRTMDRHFPDNRRTQADFSLESAVPLIWQRDEHADAFGKTADSTAQALQQF